MINQEPLYSKEEAAEYLGISGGTLSKRLLAGDIKYFRPGGGKRGAIRIRASELQRFIEAEEAKAFEYDEKIKYASSVARDTKFTNC